jgi:MraZ protein
MPMFRGNHPARIDDKGRLKLPTPFRRVTDEKYSAEFFITSITGESVRIYPLPEWESLEQRLALLPSMESAIRKFIERTNYYGQQAAFDANGRLLIPSVLRRTAGMMGDVAVMGRLFHLEVWEVERYERRLQLDNFTAEDEAVLARYGI